jgi:hypothetical protein
VIGKKLHKKRPGTFIWYFICPARPARKKVDRCNVARVAVLCATTQNIPVRCGASIFGEQGGIHDIDAFVLFVGGYAGNTRERLLVE